MFATKGTASATRSMQSGSALAKAFGTAHEAILTPSAPLEAGTTYWLGVFAFSSDLILGGTVNAVVDAAPAAFDVSSTEVRVQLP